MTLTKTAEDFTVTTKGNAADIPARGIDSWVRTIRNAYKSAKTTGEDRYVGATALQYFIIDEAELAWQPGAQLRVTPTGDVYKRNDR